MGHFARERNLRDHWERCTREPLYFFNQEVKILPKGEEDKRKIEPVPMYPFLSGQQRLFDTWWRQWSGRGYSRILVYKARQVGSTSVWAAIMFWLMLTQGNRKGFISAHHKGSTGDIFQNKIKYYYNHLSPQLQIPIQSSNSTKLTLVKRKKANGRNVNTFHGEIGVETAGNPDAARSRTLNDLLLSEVAFFPDMDALVNAAFNAVADEQGNLIMESTSCGIGNYWHNTWEHRGETLTDYERLFVSWMDSTDYTRAVSDDWSMKFYRLKEVATVLRERKSDPLSEELARLQQGLSVISYDVDKIIEHDLNAEQYAWYQYALYNKAKGQNLQEKIDNRNQEFPSTVEESFIGSGRPTFNQKRLYEMLKSATPGERRILVVDRDDREVDVVTSESGQGGVLRVWEDPVPEAKYFITADTDEGGGADNTALHCYRQVGDDLIQVASIAQISLEPNIAANEAARLGYLYNMAEIRPEITGSAGMTFTSFLRDVIGYPRIYRQQVWDHVTKKPTTKIGWRTTKGTRSLMIQKAQERVNGGKLHLNSPSTIKEMLKMQFDLKKGRHDHPRGGHDDEVIAVCIACVTAELERSPFKRRPTPKEKPAPPPDSVAYHDNILFGRGKVDAPNYLDNWRVGE